MAKILLAGVQGLAGPSSGRTGPTRPRRDRPRLDQGQCAYCKEYGHWKKECPKLQGHPGPNSRPNNDARVLLAGMDSDWRARDSDPLLESWVTIYVEGKPVRCMVDTGAQYSVLNKPTEPLSQRIILVQGATGSKAYQWTSKRQVDLG
jgi:hypothetical protein